MNTNIINKNQKYSYLNLLRFLLACMVTWSHSYALTGHGGNEPFVNIIGLHSGGDIAVFGFFFISGILITESWNRTEDARVFAVARFLRIWPALIVAIVFSATLAVYASNASSTESINSAIQYVKDNAKIIRGIEYFITGSFTENPHKGAVNGSLWTLPWEVRAYTFTLFLGLFGILRNRSSTNTILLTIIIGLYYLSKEITPPKGWDSLVVIYMLSSYALGMFVAVNRKEFGDKKIAFFLIGLFAASFIFPEGRNSWNIVTAVCAIIFWLATRKPLTPLTRKLPQFDFSYGIYIYSFPIQQIIAWKMKNITPTTMFIISIPLTIAMAAASWYLIESPALKLSHKIKNYLTKPPGKTTIP